MKGFSKIDYNHGLSKEKAILPILKRHFKKEIKLTTNRYCKYDFTDDEGNCYELKSRRNKKCTYPTTLMPCSKVLFTNNNKIYFVFCFLDELCYIKYNDEKFAKYERKPFCREYGYTEQDYLYIPVTDLETIPV